MRKTFRTIGAFALCAVLLPVFASCGDDEDEGNEPGDGPDVPAIIEDGGETGDGVYLRVTSIGNIPIYYDDKGRVEAAGSSLYIDYSSGKIRMEDEEMNIKFNGKGYISEISASWDYDDEYGSYKGDGKMTFEYNGSGNLVKCVTASKETEYSDGRKHNYDDRYTLTCKWTGGNLVSAIMEASEKDEEDYDSYTDEYTYEYGDTKNKYYQMPLSVSQIFYEEEDYMILAAAGLFGRGPAYLPYACKVSDDDGYTDDMSIEFRLNDNGSISREILDGNSIDWDYDEYVRGVFEEQPAKKYMVRSLFKRGDRK